MAEDSAARGMEVHALSCAGKPLCGWLARDAIQNCREACGGHGYLKGEVISLLEMCRLDLYRLRDYILFLDILLLSRLASLISFCNASLLFMKWKGDKVPIKSM